jgi:hypothetical protein
MNSIVIAHLLITIVFINAYYILDLTFTDIYFADKCLRVGGYLIIDNMAQNKFTIIAQNIITFFRHYELVPNKNPYNECTIFKKI